MIIRPKVSVCVPIYNVEKFIGRCARSLFNQTLEEIEYIFVNDCTPDKSMDVLREIIEEYPLKKEHVLILNHEQNKGPMSARITAMDVATGEYIIYCDSDDWVESTMYQILYETAKKENADLVICDYYIETPNKPIIHRQDPGNTYSEEVLANMLKGDITSALWNKLCRTEIDKQLQRRIKRDDRIDYCEDLLQNYQRMRQSIQIAYVAKSLYHYTINPLSITNSPNKIQLGQACQVFKLISEDIPVDNIRLTQAINIGKVGCKLTMLFSERYTQKEYNAIFPECCNYIPYKKLNFSAKLWLWIANHGGIRLFYTRQQCKRFIFRFIGNNR